MTEMRSRPRGAHTRERLLRSALQLFATRGYHGTTTAQLAAATALAEGTIYRHFPGKDALYSAVMRMVWDRGADLLADPGDGRLPSVERLRAAAARLVAEARGAPAVARLLFAQGEQQALDAPAREAADRFRAAAVQLVALGKQEGTVRPGTAELWAAVWLALVGLAVERVATGGWPPDHPSVGLTIEAAIVAIGKLPGGAAP